MALSCCQKHKTNFKFITMKTSTKPTENTAESGNKSKPLLPAVFMSKELFVKSIESLQKQIQYDISVSEKLGEVFPNSHTANLLPDNHFLHNSLLEVLQVAMNDTKLCSYGQSWIEYYCYELDFGQENWRLKVTDGLKNEIPMSNAGELYDFLANGM